MFAPPVSGSLFRDNTNTTVAALRAADPAGLHGHKSVIRAGIDRDAMRIGIGRNVLQPEVTNSIDNAHDRAIGHVSCCQVVPFVAGVVPDLVHAADIVDLRDDRARSSINHVFIGRERFAIMIRAAYKEVIPRALNDAGRHAVRHHKTVDHDGPAGDPAAGSVCELGIDFIDASDAGDTDGILIRQQQVTGGWIPGHAPQTGRRYGPGATARRGSLVTKSSRRLVEEGAVMAGDAVGHAAGCCAYARDQRIYRSGNASEGLWIGRIGAWERSPNVVNLNGRVIKSESSGGPSSRAVIVDLPQDTTWGVEMSTRILRHPRRIRSLERIVNSIVAGTEASLPGAVSESRIDWQAMLRRDIRRQRNLLRRSRRQRRERCPTDRHSQPKRR